MSRNNLLKIVVICLFLIALPIKVISAQIQLEEEPDVVFVGANTPMQLIAREDISSEKNHLGDQILMQLSGPVFSGSELALPIGLMFEAEISDLRRANTKGQLAYVDITVKNILTYAGTKIPVRAKLNHSKLSFLSGQNKEDNKIKPDEKGKPFVIKKGAKIPFIFSQTLRFEHKFPLYRMVKEEQNIRAGLSSKDEDDEFIPFFDPTQTRQRRNAFEDPAKIFSREKNKNPYF